MKLAAIDIGSNAVRLQITNTIEWENKVTFKKLEYIRFPLRLMERHGEGARLLVPSEAEPLIQRRLGNPQRRGSRDHLDLRRLATAAGLNALGQSLLDR